MLGAPIRLVVNLLYNLFVLLRRLPLALRRPPDWVVLELKGALPERQRPRRWLARARTPSVQSVARLCDDIARAPRVRGLILRIHDLEIGWATIESLRGLIVGLRARGKRAVAHLSGGGNAEYALATACDQILVDESAPLALTGLAAEATFLREALARVGVRAELHAIGEYKSAAELLTRDQMSEPNREATTAIIDDLLASLVAWTSEARKREPAVVKAALLGGPYVAAAAVEAGLCDGVLYEDELPGQLGSDGAPARLERADRFARAQGVRFRWRPLYRIPRRIAVVSVEGIIAAGEGSGPLRRVAAADAVRRALRAVRESRRIAGVVLHVDSRGGAADASDLIWREVARTAREKPTVAYLGDVAGSGGYYVVAPCRHIVAQPATLTGSIGVIGGKVVLEELLARVGVHREVIAYGDAAMMTSPAHGYSAEELRRLESELRAIYDQFVRKVADGRRAQPEHIERVARGRVWTGAAARERGLVDEMGDIRLAIDRCREAARRHARERLEVLDVRPQPRASSLVRRLIAPAGSVPDALLLPLELYQLLRRAQATLLMPFSIRIR